MTYSNSDDDDKYYDVWDDKENQVKKVIMITRGRDQKLLILTLPLIRSAICNFCVISWFGVILPFLNRKNGVSFVQLNLFS